MQILGLSTDLVYKVRDVENGGRQDALVLYERAEVEAHDAGLSQVIRFVIENTVEPRRHALSQSAGEETGEHRKPTHLRVRVADRPENGLAYLVFLGRGHRVLAAGFNP